MGCLLPKARAAKKAGAEYLILPACHVKEPTGENVPDDVASDQDYEMLDGTEVKGLKLIPVINLWEMAIAALSPREGCEMLGKSGYDGLYNSWFDVWES